MPRLSRKWLEILNLCFVVNNKMNYMEDQNLESDYYQIPQIPQIQNKERIKRTFHLVRTIG